MVTVFLDCESFPCVRIGSPVGIASVGCTASVLVFQSWKHSKITMCLFVLCVFVNNYGWILDPITSVLVFVIVILIKTHAYCFCCLMYWNQGCDQAMFFLFVFCRLS